MASALAALIAAFRGLEDGLEVAGDAVGELGVEVGKLSPILEVKVAGVPAATAAGAVAAGGNMDAGFCALWQEVVPKTTVPQSAMKA